MGVICSALSRVIHEGAAWQSTYNTPAQRVGDVTKLSLSEGGVALKPFSSGNLDMGRKTSSMIAVLLYILNFWAEINFIDGSGF